MFNLRIPPFIFFLDPNDAEGPRASVGSLPKFGLNTTTPPLSPNEDDLSLVLGTMQVNTSTRK
jgi:hypothetical protein